MPFVDWDVLLTKLLTLSFLVEAATEVIKLALRSHGIALKQEHSFVLSLLIGIGLSFALDISLFESGDSVVHLTGCVFAGLAASRGGNYIHDFIQQLRTLKR